jgi:glycolate oxidase FAD binding subunit
MVEPLKPRDAQDVETAVRWAVAEKKSLEVLGHGSKRGFGRPVRCDAVLDMSAISGVILYEPDELVLSVRAGTPLADIETLIGADRQELAFEPMDYGPLLGMPPGRGTIGGMLAANLSGPRRLRAGAPRDHFLGFTAVSGRGEAFKSGGRVVKNVTGYDLCKLLAGSWGTLGILTEVTLKVLPRAAAEATLLAFGLTDKMATLAMAAALGSTASVSGAAHLPDYMASRFPGLAGVHATTALRIESVPAALDDGLSQLAGAVRPFGKVWTLEAAESRALWRAIRDALPFSAAGEFGGRPLWRVSTAPGRGFELAAQISPAALLFYDWAGGLIWIAPPASADAGAAAIRSAAASMGGHATLVRGSPALRESIDAFQPEPAALAALTKRVKESFDPNGVLNPGRMWAGV